MNNTQQGHSTDDAEAIRRLQREWRIAKRKELEEKKRKKRFRKLESSAEHPRYGDLNATSVSLPLASSPHVRFPFRATGIHTPSSTSGTLYVGTNRVGVASQHPEHHFLDQDEQKQMPHLSQHHSVPQMHRSISASQEPQVSNQSALQASRELGQYSLCGAPHESSSAPPTTLGMSSVMPIPHESGEHSARESRTRGEDGNGKEVNTNAATSRTPNATNPFLSLSKHESAIVTGDEPDVSHVQSLIAIQRTPTMDNVGDFPPTEGASLPEEMRKKLEVEEAQRQWRENKRRELAMKRARSAGSRRGRKRAKLIPNQAFITQPVQVLSPHSSLQGAVSFPTGAAIGNGLPVSSALQNTEGSEHLQVSPPITPQVASRSIGVSMSEPISASISATGSMQLSGNFSHSSVPIPSSVAVPVVPALPVRSTSGSGYGTGNDSDAGSNPLPLNPPHQYLSTSMPERVHQSAIATTANIVPTDEGVMNVYTSVPQGTTNNTRAAATTSVLPAAPSTDAAAMLDSGSRQNENSNVTGKAFTESHSEPMNMEPASEAKEVLRGQKTDTEKCEKEESGAPNENEGGNQFRTTEEKKGITSNTHLVERAHGSTITHEADNRLPDQGRRTGTRRQSDEQGKRIEETCEKEFDVPRDSFHEDGEDDLMTWQSLASIENP